GGGVPLGRLAQGAHGDLVSPFPPPWADGTPGMRLSPVALLEKLVALVPLPHVPLVRYGGGLAPHSHLRGSVIPTPRPQGLDGEEPQMGTPYGTWARLRKRVLALARGPRPLCHGAPLPLSP